MWYSHRIDTGWKVNQSPDDSTPGDIIARDETIARVTINQLNILDCQIRISFQEFAPFRPVILTGLPVKGVRRERSTV